MGFLMGILSSIGIMTNTTSLVEATIGAAAIESGIVSTSLAAAGQTLGFSLVIGGVAYGGYYAYQHWDEVKDYVEPVIYTFPVAILAGETLGMSLVLSAASASGCYAYQHWDEIKDYVNQSLNTIKSYWPW